MWRFFRLLSPDVVSMVAVECQDGLISHGRVFLSVNLAQFQVFAVILWTVGVLSLFFFNLMCPTKEGF